MAAVAVLPWARWGSAEFPLSRLPWWGLYLGTAIAMHVSVAWFLFAKGRLRRVLRAVGLTLVGSTVVTAVLVMTHYDDASALFDKFVPLVYPIPGEGGLVALLAAALSAAALTAPPQPTPLNPADEPTSVSLDDTRRLSSSADANGSPGPRGAGRSASPVSCS